MLQYNTIPNNVKGHTFQWTNIGHTSNLLMFHMADTDIIPFSLTKALVCIESLFVRVALTTLRAAIRLFSSVASEVNV